MGHWKRSGKKLLLLLISFEILKFVGNALSSAQQNQATVRSTQTNGNRSSTIDSDDKQESKLDEDRKRERNILSSRKYRAKR